MQPASSYFSCPRCHTLQAISPTLAGQAVTCPVCRTQFVVPHAAAASGALPASIAAPPAPVVASLGPAPPPERPTSAGSAAPARASRGLWLEITFFGTFITLFIVGLLVVVMIAGRKKLGRPSADGADPQETVIDVESGAGESETPHWSDAKRFTLRKDAVKIKVREVVWAPVRTRDGARRVVDEQGQFLAVYISLRNARDAPRSYRSWYGSLFRVEGRQRSAELYDDAGRLYRVHKFTSATGVQGHVPQATLLRSEETRDVLVFAVPEDVDRKSIEWFHLELPGAAYGSEGLLRFEIPVDMIQGW